MQAAPSAIAGYLSILCWVIVFTPQLWENYKLKSGEGLSMSFLIIWLAGDLFNLAGVILQGLLPTMFVLALYYSVADIALIWQVLYYRECDAKILVVEEEIDASSSNNRSPSQQDDETEPLLGSSGSGGGGSADDDRRHKWRAVAATHDPHRHPRRMLLMHFLFGISIIVLTAVSCYSYIRFDTSSSSSSSQPQQQLLQDSDKDDTQPQQEMQILPQIFGWCSAVLYVSSRMPQIIKNWKEQSVEGLSKLLFICAVGGNVFFTASIFLRSVDPYYILINLSWIVGSVGTLVFDLVIFIQFFMYGKRHKVEEQT